MWLAVEPIAHRTDLLAAADASDDLAIAVTVEPDISPVPSIRLANISVDFGARYSLISEGGETVLDVAVIKCHEREGAVREMFLEFAALLVDELPLKPSSNRLAEVLDGWITLFWRLGSPPRSDLVGLIGELVVVDAARDPVRWVEGWHQSAQDRIDFRLASPLCEVEVKATTGRERTHVLTLHQVTATTLAPRFFASVLVEFADTGDLVGDLMDEVAGRLPAGLTRRKFWAIVSETCGSALAEMRASRFVREVSRSSLRFYDARSVPRPVVGLPLPVGVSDLKFRSDFSSCDPVSDVSSP